MSSSPLNAQQRRHRQVSVRMAMLLNHGNNLLPLKRCSRNEFKKICSNPCFDWRDLAPPLTLSVLSGKPNYGLYLPKTVKSVSVLLSDSVRLCPTLSGQFRTKSDTYPDTKIRLFPSLNCSLSFPDNPDITYARTGAGAHAHTTAGGPRWN